MTDAAFALLMSLVGSFSQPAALFLAWPPGAGMSDSQPHDFTLGELAKERDLELEALNRRAGPRVARDEHDLGSAI